MSSRPPFYAQEGRYTCALACLRAILAHNGVRVSEEDLVRKAQFEVPNVGWVTPEELARLPRKYGLSAVEQKLAGRTLNRLIRNKQWPITFLWRGPIDGVQEGHAVIPTEVRRTTVVYLDPLFGTPGDHQVRRRAFEEARRIIGQWAVVWKP